MSGNYVIHCSCGVDQTLEPQQLRSETIESSVRLIPAFTALCQEDWEIGDIRGVCCDAAANLIWFVLGHWRHGELSYSYDNNSEPPVVLVIPPETALPDPCPSCKGRRLVPCPEC